MTAMSDFLENEVLTDKLVTGTGYLALFTTATADDGTGTEVAGNGYAREALTMSVANGVASLDADVTFTANGANWGSITHIGIFDAATAGNLLFHGPLDAAKTVNDGESLKFVAADDDITVTLD